jgi:hypothetical protein
MNRAETEGPGGAGGAATDEPGGGAAVSDGLKTDQTCREKGSPISVPCREIKRLRPKTLLVSFRAV